VDIAGLSQGASRGEGLGNQFLGHIRNVDALVHVVRCFTDPTDPDNAPNAVDDEETLRTELLLADLQSIGKQIERVEREARKGTPEAKRRLAALKAMEEHLSGGGLAKDLDEPEAHHETHLLTDKPVIYVANVDEKYAAGGCPEAARLKNALPAGSHVLEISARIESELVDLAEEEREEFMRDLGIPEPGLDRLARDCYSMLNLISFLTVGPDECRAWTIRRGTRAQDAAGVIHSDLARGFIRAEIIPWEVLVEAGSWHAAKERGAARLEGRDYIVQDGDVIQVRFQV
jgi:GTP-binding protein YchF